MSGQEVYIVYLAQFKTSENKHVAMATAEPQQKIKMPESGNCVIARLLDHRKRGRLSAGSSVSWPPCAGCVCEAPLAAGVLDDESGGAALVPALSIAAAGRVRLSTAAEEALH